MSSKQQWRTRVRGTNSQMGTHYPIEPHGDKRSLQKGITIVTPPTARKWHLTKVSLSKLPKTSFHTKKDKDVVNKFKDLILQGRDKEFSPILVHQRPDATWEVLDGKHRIEAYRELGITKIPVVSNATVAEIAKALGDAYEDDEMSKPRSFAEKKALAMRAIAAQRGSPLVEPNSDGAFDALNPLSSGETQTQEIIAGRRRKLVKSGDLVTKGQWRTRTSGTDGQIGTHFPLEPHGDKNTLPKDVTAIAQSSNQHVPTNLKAGLDVQYIDEEIHDKEGNKYMAMNYYEAKELGIYFPYPEEAILISKSLSGEDRQRALEIQVREIAKMKSGISYIEAHAQVITEMPEMKTAKREGFWDSAKKLAITAMNRQRRVLERPPREVEMQKAKAYAEEAIAKADREKELNALRKKHKKEQKQIDREHEIIFGISGEELKENVEL